jgi:hypothetical protein
MAEHAGGLQYKAQRLAYEAAEAAHLHAVNVAVLHGVEELQQGAGSSEHQLSRSWHQGCYN